MFSDESDIFPKKCGRLFMRKYQGEVLYADHTPQLGKDLRKIKIWGSIGFDGVGPLIRYTGTINK